MTTFSARTALAAALVTCVTLAACEDVPLVPKWDADWYVPLPSEAIFLQSSFGAVPIPPGTSAPIAFPPQTQTMDESIGQVLGQEIRSASLIMTLAKAASLEFSATDTLVVAASQADLTNAAATRIVIPIVVAPADVSVVDTVAVNAAGIAMLKSVADVNGDLWIQLRGVATYQGAAPYTVQATDSIGVRLALLARIAVSR